MGEDIRVCVTSRTEFFEKYVVVPEAVRGDVEDFIRCVNELGDACADAGEFEARFVSQGLSDRFNSLIPRCAPKAYQMTQEDKAHSREVAKEIFREDKERIIKEAVADVADSVYVAAESEVIAQQRKRMIEDGTYDEYTRITNKIEDAGIVARFFKGLGKKKK
jgi:hypothetical protein